ncbi:FHA domain-containing protein [Desulfosarcina cetonica]|nr:FHA domain-containing protein [Desulfosarcina cetonica]
MNASAPAVLRITLAQGTSLEFNQPFTIGRHSACAVCIPESVVSRRHADVFWEEGQWWIQDRQSANGIFIDGQRIERAVLFGTGQIRLGAAGPLLAFDVLRAEVTPVMPVPPDPPKRPESPATTHATTVQLDLDHYKEHYFGKTLDQTAGEHTIMVRRAFAEVQKRQRLTYGVIIGVVVMLLIVTGAVAWYKHSQITAQRKLAAEIFYTMRGLEIDLIKLRMDAEQRKSEAAGKQIREAKARKQKLEESYGRYVDSLGIYGEGLSEQEKTIMRMAHRFGECEINMPKGFVAEVSEYIQKWKSSKRFPRVIHRAIEMGYIPTIVSDLRDEDLPIQFFYLAVQESNLDPDAVGPATRFGYAKGMWQFIPSTAEKYGLRVGPWKDDGIMDPEDERHDFEKSTRAAASYLRDIYTTDAQASGLLVMASYNWGERRVIKLIQTLPEDPRERNFWKLITTYRDKIPDETYNYVFYIFTAAVIGENPRLFGFDFDNPLASAEP